MTVLPCPPAQWARFSRLLDSALELPEAGRLPWLATLAGEDAICRPWLARVLGSQAATGGAFLQPVADAPALAAGDRVGPYALEALLGQGGMGQVWRARPPAGEGPQRAVALKLPQPELLGGPFRARFLRERDALAALSHPNIAQLYDAGVSIEGYPYLALELIDGASIVAYARTARATLAARLGLIAQVLTALAYAHARLIVHRDIKPSNLLVTPDGTVKLLDFGIAKLLRDDAIETILTGPAARLATPVYGAPEQFAGGAVTVATDLFSAGVLLFELLTGEPPFAAVPADVRAPPAPAASSRAEPKRIGCPEANLARRLRGDADAVIGCALALAPGERYASAEAFLRDVRRLLAGEPVAARPVGFAARAMKFARRNKLAVGLAAGLSLAVAGGTAGVAWQAARAERQAARATAVKDFLIDLLTAADARSDTGIPMGERRAKDLLDAGAARAHAAFARDPQTELELLAALGDIYDSYGDAAHAEAVGAQRLALAQRVWGGDDPRTVDAAIQAINSAVLFDDYATARRQLSALEGRFERVGAASLQRAQFLFLRSMVRDSEPETFVQGLADAGAAARLFAARYPDDRDYANALDELGRYRLVAEDFGGAARAYAEGHDADVAHGFSDALERAQYQVDEGRAVLAEGRVEEGMALLRSGEAATARMMGPTSNWTAAAQMARADGMHRLGDRAAADALFAGALRAPQGDGGLPMVLRGVYGAALAREGSAGAAVALLEPALAAARPRRQNVWLVPAMEQALGDAQDQLGDAAAARRRLAAAREDRQRLGLPHTNATLAARERWARFLLERGETEAAAAEFRRVVADAAGPGPALALAQAGLSRIALARGQAAAATAASAAAMATMDGIRVLYDRRAGIEVWLARAAVLSAAGAVPAACGLATQASRDAALWDAPEAAERASAESAAAQLCGGGR